MAEETKLTKRQWVEIAAVAFFVALIAYLLRHAFASSYETPNQTQEVPIETSASQPAGTYTLPTIGIAPVPLPGKSGNGCDCDCGGGGCAAGSSDPTITQIVANANASLVSIHNSIVSTENYLAALGNYDQDVLGNGQIQFEVENG